MAAISPNADGVLDVRENNSEQIANAIHQAVAAALEEIGLAAERFAKRACPVDTGRLRNSVTHALNMDEEAVYIGSNVSYAPFVELDVVVNGKQRDGAHFLRDAAQNHGSYYRKIMEQHLAKG
jgi:phage gpG-like protein